jgi:subtilisin family serine protease
MIIMFRKRIFLFPLVLILLLSSSWAVFAERGNFQNDRPDFMPSEVLVKYRDGVSDTQIANTNQGINAQVIRYFAFIDVYHLKFPEDISVNAALQHFRGNPLVTYAVPNGLYYLDVTLPDDPRFNEMWGLHNVGQEGGTPDADIDAPEAWEITKGSDDVVIAVIDSGVDLSHEDIAGNIWTNTGEIPDNGIDDDLNGFVDDVHGWDFSSNDNDPSPAGGACVGHGTHVAGTIGALGNNSLGVVGVNWNVKIMPLKAFQPILGIFCSASDSNLIAAIEYHTTMGVPVSSNSWGGGSFNAAMQDAILASNSVFVAAAGNGGLDAIGDDNDTTPHYPSNYTLYNIIAVAATDRNDTRAGFSNYGLTTVDLGAPGLSILSTLHNGNYGKLSGTSMATPHVAGVAGLLLAQDPSLTINEIKWRLLKGTDNISLPVLTRGRLNANGSLQYGLSTPTLTVELTPIGPTNLPPGGTVHFRVSVTNHGPSSIGGILRIYLRLSDGRALSLGELNGSIIGGTTISGEVSKVLPSSFGPGTSFRIFGQIETATSFDEDWIEFNVVP